MARQDLAQGAQGVSRRLPTPGTLFMAIEMIWTSPSVERRMSFVFNVPSHSRLRVMPWANHVFDTDPVACGGRRKTRLAARRDGPVGGARAGPRSEDGGLASCFKVLGLA